MTEPMLPLLECARACELCAEISEQALRASPGYGHAARPYTLEQIALLAFWSTCTSTASALRDARHDLVEMCRWCREACVDIASREQGKEGLWSRLQAAAHQCSSLCAQIVEDGKPAAVTAARDYLPADSNRASASRLPSPRAAAIERS